MRLLYFIQKWILPTVYEFWIIMLTALPSTFTLIASDLVISRYLRHTILFPIFEHYYIGFVILGMISIFIWLNLATIIVNLIYDKFNWLKIDSNSYL